MKLTDVKACISAEPSLELIAVEVDEVVIYVKHTAKDGGGLVYQLRLNEMDDDATWDEIEPVLTGHRTPGIMQWMTRIVGYYSSVKMGADGLTNWNPSKLSELADRQRGNYRVE